VTSARQVALGFILLFAVAALPVLTVSLPPLVDYPNHLARMHILMTAGHNEPLDRYYATNWAWQPNLAMDMMVPALARLMPLETAGRLFILIIFALIAGGALWLHRTIYRRWSLWPLAAFLFLYNRVLLWGFLNYLFGVGLALCGLALWLRLLRHPWLRLLTASALAILLYFSHIAAFGAYALMVAGAEIEPLWKALRGRDWRGLGRRTILLAVPFLAPILVFLSTWHDDADGELGFGRFWRKADLLFSVFDDYNRAFDAVCFALTIGALGVLAARRRLGFARGPAWSLGLLVAAYLLLPSQLLGGSGADHRMPVMLFVLFVAVSMPRLDRRWALGIGGLLGAIFLVRMAVIERAWVATVPIFDAARAALDQLPVGARLAVGFPEREVNVTAVSDVHLPTLTVLDRDGLVPTLFAIPSQQPVLVREPYVTPVSEAVPEDVWGSLHGDGRDHGTILRTLKGFDFVVLMDREPFQIQQDCLRPLYLTPTFQLFAFDYTAGPCVPKW